MSHILYDFLNDSPLFLESYIRDDFSNLTDSDLSRELQRYRDYVMEHLHSLQVEIQNASTRLSVSIQGFDTTTPRNNLLKQLSLYMDAVIISDPIFKLTTVQTSTTQTLGKYLGLGVADGVDRRSLSEACTYMKSLAPLVAIDYVKFSPISLLHEPPSELFIYHSDNYFADILPHELLDYFYKKVKVYPMQRVDGGWGIFPEKKLEPCRGIAIEFDGHSENVGNFYHLFESEVVSMDEETGRVLFRQHLPDTPPEKNYFNAWVSQSVNRSAGGFMNQVLSEIYQSSSFGSMYLTTSPFVQDLLGYKLNIPGDFKSEIANLVLDLELPVLEDVSLEDLMSIRTQDGEAFHNFRIALEKNLRGLRGVHDSDQLRRELENVAHEMSEVQVNEIQTKIRTVKKTSGIDMAIATASLSAAIQSHGLSLLGLGVVLAKGYKNYTSYIRDVKQNPAYFLWRATKH